MLNRAVRWHGLSRLYLNRGDRAFYQVGGGNTVDEGRVCYSCFGAGARWSLDWTGFDLALGFTTFSPLTAVPGPARF